MPKTIPFSITSIVSPSRSRKWPIASRQQAIICLKPTGENQFVIFWWILSRLWRQRRIDVTVSAKIYHVQTLIYDILLKVLRLAPDLCGVHFVIDWDIWKSTTESLAIASEAHQKTIDLTDSRQVYGRGTTGLFGRLQPVIRLSHGHSKGFLTVIKRYIRWNLMYFHVWPQNNQVEFSKVNILRTVRNSEIVEFSAGKITEF